MQTRADVVVTFYSYDLGEHFPHAFFTTQGELSDGAVIDAQYGFTPIIITPAILLGSINGEVSDLPEKYIQKSNPHFAIDLDDGQYETLMAVVKDWSDRPGKSYNLNKRNCVHFVRDALIAIGISVNEESSNFKKPKSFLREVSTLNLSLQLPLSGTSSAQIPIAPPAPPVAPSIEGP